MSRRRPSPPEQTDLLAPSAKGLPKTTDHGPRTTDQGTAGEPPALLDYTPLTRGEKWRVERFRELVAEFGLAPGRLGGEGPFAATMARFHFVAQDHSRPWLFVRRLFGIAPLIPAADAHPDDLRVHTRVEVCASFGIAPLDLQAELDALRAVWGATEEHEARTSDAPGDAGDEKTGGPAFEVLALDDGLLERHGFTEKMFKVMMWDPPTKAEVPRDDRENRVERDWFCKRVGEMDKMLADSLAGPVAREALLNELYLRRIAAEMTVVSPTTSKYRDLHGLKKQTEDAYNRSLDKLQLMFPELAVAGKVTFRGVISDLSAGARAYYGYGDRRLVDKVRTAAELEWQLRVSQQMPAPRYRFGLNIAIVEAIHGLYDPNFRSQFKPSVLRQLDEGFRVGALAAREAQKLPVVDLERGVLPGEGDEFEDYKPEREKAESGKAEG